MSLWNFIDLTGLKFNHLTVIQLHCGGHGLPLQWECRCDCGNICIKPGHRLRNFSIKSCGCIKKRTSRFIDLTGQKFNMLRVVSLFRRGSGKRGAKWNCVCDCGKDKVVSGDKLKNGHTKSCGCLLINILKNRFIDLTGQKFNMLTVISLNDRTGKRISWNCLCDCGNSTIVRGTNLQSGGVKSCGCLVYTNKANVKHGFRHTRLYAIWDNMKGRCYRPSMSCFKDYGARGIKICDEWLKDCTKFFEWALSNGYTDELTIERIDVNGDYEPSNCKWIPAYEQGRNTRVSLGVEKAKEIKDYLKNGVTIKWLATKYNVHESTIGYIKSGKNYPYVN